MPMIGGKFYDSPEQAMRDMDVEGLLQDCYRSHKALAQAIFPKRFFLPFSEKIHDPIFKVLDDTSIQKSVIIAPRGCGKTSLLSLLGPAHAILFRTYRFIVLIARDAMQAITQSENLKGQFLTNKNILKLFGPIRTGRSKGSIDQFSKELWITEAQGDWPGTKIFPRGSGQGIRGALIGDDRPDLVLIDDLEDPRKLLNRFERARQRDWFFGDVCYTPMKARPYRIICLGSLLHEDCLLAHLKDDPAWYTVELELCDDDGNSYWPEYISTKQIKLDIEEYRRQDRLHIFYRECRGRLIPTEDKTFEQKNFLYYEEAQLNLNKNQNVESFILVDPAKSSRTSEVSDTAIIGVGVNFISNCYYVRDCVVGRIRWDNIWNEIISMADRLGARTVGIEVTGFEDSITYPFQNEVLRQGKNIKLVELRARGEKLDRIKSLIPMYRMGRVYHNPASCNRLEGQLLSYPYSKKMDAADALAYIFQLLELEKRYFTSEQNPEEQYADIETSEDQYKELYKGSQPIRNWQRW